MASGAQAAEMRAGTGVQFPEIDGKRSSTATGKAVFADAARVIDAEIAAAIETEADWRSNYFHHLRRLLVAELRRPERAPDVPRAGLESLHRRFVFVRDGEAVPLRTACETPAERPLHATVVRGQGTASPEVAVPYKGQLLSGDALHRQLDLWVATCIVEPSFADAIRLVAANPEWLDLSDQTVALLGAGAEMGPLGWLCRWNATIAAVDVPQADVWRRVLEQVRQGAGRVLVPTREPVADGADITAVANVAGVDLLTELPEVAAWLGAVDVAPMTAPLLLGNYVYADGADHARLAMAVDALITHLAARRELAVAMLITPMDLFAVPKDVVDLATANRARRGTSRIEPILRGLSRQRLYQPHFDETVRVRDGREYGIADAVLPQQGPNYALAKGLQRWRARLARDQGMVSSANVAPSSRTRSVMSNRIFAAGYNGASRFGVEVLDPPTSSALMAAMLVHDLRNEKSSAQPDRPLDHPLDLFVEGAAHGGVWTCPYLPRSVLPVAAIRGLLSRS